MWPLEGSPEKNVALWHGRHAGGAMGGVLDLLPPPFVVLIALCDLEGSSVNWGPFHPPGGSLQILEDQGLKMFLVGQQLTLQLLPSSIVELCHIPT